MKTVLFSIFTLYMFCFAIGQIAHDLTVYSEEGIKFNLMLNGKIRTEEFTTNVELKNVQLESVKAVVGFEDTSIPAIEKSLYLAKAGTGEKPPMSNVYVIKRNKKGEVKMRIISQTEKMIQNSPTIIINNNH